MSELQEKLARRRSQMESVDSLNSIEDAIQNYKTRSSSNSSGLTPVKLRHVGEAVSEDGVTQRTGEQHSEEREQYEPNTHTTSHYKEVIDREVVREDSSGSRGSSSSRGGRMSRKRGDSMGSVSSNLSALPPPPGTSRALESSRSDEIVDFPDNDIQLALKIIESEIKKVKENNDELQRQKPTIITLHDPEIHIDTDINNWTQSASGDIKFEIRVVVRHNRTSTPGSDYESTVYKTYPEFRQFRASLGLTLEGMYNIMIKHYYIIYMK